MAADIVGMKDDAVFVLEDAHAALHRHRTGRDEPARAELLDERRRTVAVDEHLRGLDVVGLDVAAAMDEKNRGLAHRLEGTERVFGQAHQRAKRQALSLDGYKAIDLL